MLYSTTWKAAANGNWSTASAWTSAAPTAGESAGIELIGNYTVSLTGVASASLLNFGAIGATLLESSAGALTLSGVLTVDAGLVQLNGVNTLGGTQLNGGLLGFGNSGALGSGPLTITGGELLGTASATVAPSVGTGAYSDTLVMSGDFTIAAAAGTTLNLNPGHGWELDEGDGDRVTFGAVGSTGTVVWHTPVSSHVPTDKTETVEIAAGTLKAGDALFGFLFNHAATEIDAGATVDLAGFGVTASYPMLSLEGSGKIVNSGALAELNVVSGLFGGTISGAVALKVLESGVAGSLTLTGANTYSGGTTITGADELLILGGSAGAIAGSVSLVGGGTLGLARSTDFTLANAISGTGHLSQSGTDTVTITRANTYGGSTSINNGTLAIANADGLGASTIVMGGTGSQHPELLATANLTLDNALVLKNNATVAAATGSKLVLQSTTPWSVENSVSGKVLAFGASGQAGTVEWHTNGSPSFTGTPVVEVKAGTLQTGDTNFGGLLAQTGSKTTVDSSATLNLNGFDTTIADLLGSGTVTSSTAAALTLDGGSFSGKLSGHLTLDLATGTTTLKGSNTYDGTGSGVATNITGYATAAFVDGSTATSLGTRDVANDGIISFSQSNTLTIANNITGNGTLYQNGPGTTILTGNNSFFGVELVGGILGLSSDQSLGSTIVIQVQGGEILATGNVTLHSDISIVRTTANFGAMTGKTLTLNAGTHWDLGGDEAGDDVTVTFGAPGQGGTVIWDGAATGNTKPYGFLYIEVASGTLTAGDSNFKQFTSDAYTTTVDSGAKLDIAGFDTTLNGAMIDGQVVNSSSAALLTLHGSTIGGGLSGALNVSVTAASTWSGTQSYTGTTEIVSGITLDLQKNASVGSGIITDSGQLVFDGTQVVTLAQKVTGAGSITQQGSGSVTLSGANDYQGGTTLKSGTLGVGSSTGLGSGPLAISGGELLGTATKTIGNVLTMSGSFTIAAAHGAKPFGLGGNGWTLTETAASGATPASRMTFGASGQDGIVQWFSPNSTSHLNNSGSGLAEIAFGTLKAGDASLSTLLLAFSSVTVDAGATIDSAGHGNQIHNLLGKGTVTDSGAADLLILHGADFDGALTGGLSLSFTDSASLGGTSNYSGSTAIGAGTTLSDSGTFMLTTDVGMTGGTTAKFANTGLFEKTGGSGASAIAVDFINSGRVLVTSGSIAFDDGFSNAGLVQGVLLHSGSTWTVSANDAGQTTYFGGTGDNLVKVTVAPTYFEGGGGSDTLEVAANMTLGAGSLVSVETIKVDNGFTADLSALTLGEKITLASTSTGHSGVIGTQGNDTITGGSGTDSISGGAGNDSINGGTGADTMTGGAGNDIYVVDNSGDIVDESVSGSGGTDTIQSSISISLGSTGHYKGSIENLTLTGSSVINATGNSLANVLTGNDHANTLTGGSGDDTFVFNTTLGSSNIDTVADFSVSDDTIELDNDIFKALTTTGTLHSSAFTTGTPTTTSQHIIYNSTTGTLSYDADGSSAGAAVVFAQLHTGLALTHNDFTVVS